MSKISDTDIQPARHAHVLQNRGKGFRGLWPPRCVPASLYVSMILILVPPDRDWALPTTVLGQAGVRAEVCRDIEQLEREERKRAEVAQRR